MKVTKQQVESLIQTVRHTRDDELDCDQCLQQVAEFAERALAGKSVLESQAAVQHHLEICGECREEYEALLRSLEL